MRGRLRIQKVRKEMKLFREKIIEKIMEFDETQDEKLKIVAKVIVDHLENNGRCFAVGTGHSHMIAEEMEKREMVVPVFLSSNVDAGDAWNHAIMKEYYHII